VRGSLPTFANTDFDKKIFECVDSALHAIGRDQRELLRLRLRNRHSLPLKHVGSGPDTFEQSLVETVGPAAATMVTIGILKNISATFGIHVPSDSSLVVAVETARKTSPKLSLLPKKRISQKKPRVHYNKKMRFKI